ncbi:hypothetical protein LN429_15965 [Pseudomonas syringae]|uniref:hypothetical protein n=1 Tax=Pseudomonas syringae TaxID=317 RepID=UPI00234C3C91|nr:hypothetical protein [Pseudomonas syringae]MDC6536601.1 hypothetical protein [Pseudomonas syringae]
MPRKNHLIVDSGCTQDNERWALSACGLNEDSNVAWDGTYQGDFVSCKRCLANMAKPRPAPEPFHKERPILFNGAMVRAILSGQKTVTRRLVKGNQVPSRSKSDSPEHQWIAVVQDHPRWGFAAFGATEEECAAELAMYGGCPYGRQGDRLWVREAWAADVQVDSIAPRDLSQGEPIFYPADGAVRQTGCSMITQGRGRPSIHMPRWASRILLEITDVRVERLQDISRADIRAEGLLCPSELASDDVTPNYRDWYPAAFRELWNSTGGDWEANPWVWVIQFKQVASTVLVPNRSILLQTEVAQQG